MARSSRLFRLAEGLRTCETTTLARLSDELGVSVRTIRRDLSALREAGQAITSEPGRGGGIRLEDRHGLASVQLAVDEAVWAWLGMKLAERAGSLPWSRAAAGASRKLLASLPLTRRRRLLEFGKRIILGPAPTPSMLGSFQRVPSASLPLIERAFTERLTLSLHYESSRGTSMKRRVEPHGLLVQAPLWYLLTFDLERQAPRMFRVDRIRSAELVAQAPFTPRPEVAAALLPPGFDWRPLV